MLVTHVGGAPDSRRRATGVEDVAQQADLSCFDTISLGREATRRLVDPPPADVSEREPTDG